MHAHEIWAQFSVRLFRQLFEKEAKHHSILVPSIFGEQDRFAKE
jgi:hypothetical protein